MLGLTLSACFLLGDADKETGASTTPCWSTDACRRVFATSTFYGVTEIQRTAGTLKADTACNARAAAAGLTGTYKAWVSDSAQDAIAHITDVGPWYLMDGTTLVFQNLAQIPYAGGVGGPSNPINQDEYGALISSGTTGAATGSNAAGENDLTKNCSNWADSGSTMEMGGGLITQTGSAWATGHVWNCNVSLRLYCFEQ